MMYQEFLAFPKNFRWGASTAAFQIEGGYDEDGKGLSIWDEFSSHPEHIADGHNGKVTCDSYHKWQEDIALMKQLGIKNYRLSIAWTRIFPDGTKESFNEKGLQYYEMILGEMVKNGITPFVTLFHWDLPLALQEKGGFANKHIVESFYLYATTVIQRLSPLVHNWMTFNEPWVFSYVGHYKGAHAPGLKDLKTTLQVTHNILLSHARVVEYVHQNFPDARIGIVNNVEKIESASKKKEDVDAARRWDLAFNKWYFDPLFKGAYPEELVEFYTHHRDKDGREENVMVETTNEEMAFIQTHRGDFMGLNYYTRRLIQYDATQVHLRAQQIYRPMLQRAAFEEWEINPEAFYSLLCEIKEDIGDFPLLITESGTSGDDFIGKDGCVHDHYRVEYLRRHFAAVYQAIQDGVDIQGYFVWSLLDNYEWAFGFTKRFGLIFTDYEDDCQRIIKDSGHFVAHVIRHNGFEIN